MVIKKYISFLFIIVFWLIQGNIFSQNPIILSVDVLDNGNVEIRWDYPPGDEGLTYTIKKWLYYDGVDQGYQIEVESVNASEMSIIDESVVALSRKQIYRIFEGSSSESEEMQTIFLFEDIAFNECALTNTIKWTGVLKNYELVSYNIKFSTNNGISFTSLGSFAQNTLTPVDSVLTYDNEEVQGNKKYTDVFEYIHQILNPGLSYIYKVEAVYDVNGVQQTSGSNLQFSNTFTYPRPDLPKISTVTINESNEIEILGEITADGTAVINGTSIWRTNSQNSADLRFYTDLNQTSPGVINYTDESVAVDQTAYWYSIVLEDYCSFSLPENPTENAHRSIFLTANVIDNEQVELNWNAYEGWTPDRYRIFRKTTTDAYIPIGATSNLQFTDNTVTTGNISGSIIYFVQAESRDPNTRANITSSSNRVKVGFDSPFFVPNAFRPSSGIFENQIFKPLSRFLPAGNYIFQIYDRWGKLLFESTDFNEGWDGKVNGNEAPQGVYLWRYSYNNSEGKTLEDKGTVMLIR